MPNRVLSRLAPLPVLNTLTAVILLLSAPAVIPTVEDNPTTAVVTLDQSATQLASQFPLELTFTDRMGIAEFAPLPAPLLVDGAARMSSYRAGDIAYLASEQSVVVFLSDGAAVPDDDLMLIGHVASGLDNIADCVRDCVVRLAADAVAQ